jgi:hypothetical protein
VPTDNSFPNPEFEKQNSQLNKDYPPGGSSLSALSADYLIRKIQLPPATLVNCDREYGWRGIRDEEGKPRLRGSGSYADNTRIPDGSATGYHYPLPKDASYAEKIDYYHANAKVRLCSWTQGGKEKFGEESGGRNDTSTRIKNKTTRPYGILK